MDTEPTIRLQSLSKSYRGSDVYALKDVSLHVNPGEVYGFLGPNGAGKSTTIRCLLNFIQPTEGSATILGLDIVRDSFAVKKHVGYLAGDVALYSKMTGKQFFAYMTELQPLKHRAYLSQLVTDFGAEVKKSLDVLSKGNRQKIGLIQALMHEPEVLILDEPTSGLDPLMQEVFFAKIRQAKERGCSIFVSSHNLGEVQRICDRVGFIRGGKLVSEQTIADLASSAHQTFDITFAGKAPMAELKKLQHAQVHASADDTHVTVVLQGALSPFFAILGKHNVKHIEQQEINLEEEFLHFYKKDRA